VVLVIAALDLLFDTANAEHRAIEGDEFGAFDRGAEGIESAHALASIGISDDLT
jgi:hypothetical protein